MRSISSTKFPRAARISTRAVHSRRANDQRLIEIRARIHFACQFRHRVCAQRTWRIFFQIGAASQPVEHVIGRKVHQTRVHLTASHRQIANREPVHQERRLRLFFRDVHLIVGSRVDHHRRGTAPVMVRSTARGSVMSTVVRSNAATL